MSCFSRQIVQKPKKCRKAAEHLISWRLQHKLAALERKSDINSWMHVGLSLKTVDEHHAVRYCRVSVCRFIVSCVVLQTVQRRRRRTALLWGHRPPPRTQAAARKGPSHSDEVTLIKDEPMLQSVFAFDCFFNDRRGFKVKCSFIGVMSCLSSCSAVRSQGSLRPRPPPRPHPPPPVLPLLPPPPPPRRSPLGSPPSPRRPSPPTAWGTSVESCWWRRCRLTVRTDLFHVFTILRRWRDLEAL